MSFLNSAKMSSNGTLSDGGTLGYNWMYYYSNDYYAQSSWSYSSINTDYDYYNVSLTKGKSYTFSTSDSYSWGYGLNTKLYLINSSGSTVATSTDISSWDDNDTLSFKATTTGQFYLVVENANSSSYSYGYYNVSMSAAANSAPELTGSKASLSQFDLNKGTSYTIKTSDLLIGFSDENNDTLSVNSLSVDSGTISNNGNGTWTFTPTSTAIQDSTSVNLTYSVTDGQTTTAANSSFSMIPKDADPEIKFEQVNDKTNEDGTISSLKVYLTKNPATTANSSGKVQFTFISDDLTEGKISGAAANGSYSFTLDSTNWSTGVTINVIGQQDYLNDGSVSYKLKLTSLKTTTSEYDDVVRQNTKTSWTFVNSPDLTEEGKDRDAPIYLVGDKNGPTKDNLTGLDGADRLYGGYMVDELSGGMGDDRLYGSYENDYMYGGSGNDQLFGEQDDDSLFGGAGNDRLDGGSGADSLEGGSGNDIYYLSLDDDGLVEDEVVELTNEGTDTVYIPFEVEEYTAPENVEVIKMNAGFSNTIVTGNKSNNTMTGNGGDNVLDGGAGTDDLAGGLGDDTLTGGTGDDVLSGGRGQDTLEGGVGNDRFKFTATSDSSSTSAADIILDLSQGDKIDLSSLDADTSKTGDQSFKFINAGGTSSSASTFNSNQIGTVKFFNDYLYINNDKDSSADLVINVLGVDIDSSTFSTYIIA